MRIFLVRVLPDLSPLRESPQFRRLYLGNTFAAFGSQIALVTLGIQVFELTSSTAMVGAVSAAAFVPLVGFGLYGGALADQYDRRRVALVAQAISWATSIAAAALALRGNRQVWPLFLIVIVWTASFAVTSAARSAIYPRILPPRALPAANVLQVFTMNGSMLIGPVMAGFLIDSVGYSRAYVVDAVVTTCALWGIAGLPAIPPEREAGTNPGWRSVVAGLAYLRRMPNVRMTFVADIAAMVLAQPTVLLPAAGSVILGGGARTVGILYACVAAGGLLAMFASGSLGEVRHQGAAIMVSITGWGLGISGLGLALLGAQSGALSSSAGLIAAGAALAGAGACDAVSGVFRSTILQSAAPDDMRGRLQGIFIAVVAGGPRLGALLGGAVADRLGVPWTGILGGMACIAAIAVLSVWHRHFLEYDSHHPVP